MRRSEKFGAVLITLVRCRAREDGQHCLQWCAVPEGIDTVTDETPILYNESTLARVVKWAEGAGRSYRVNDRHSKGPKPLRWEGLIAYVGKLEVGRIQRQARIPGSDSDLWVSVPNEFGLSALGVYDSDDMKGTMDRIMVGRRIVERNWLLIEEAMSS